MSEKLLLLVDGSSYLYRAYHALPDLRSPDGFPTGALHGFVAMMKRLREQFPAEHAACVFDAKGPTFRDALYAEYKAHRAPMPEPLVQQIAPIHEVVRLLGWPVLEVPGIEADDAIGTLARVAAASGHRVVISTGDKDLAQLVDADVTLINTMSNERLDVAGVEQKFGVPPERIVDYLALVGDSVDNVPGVEKVGPKTAAKWIAEYGSLGRRDRRRRRHQGRRRREPAQGARLVAARAQARHGGDRLRPLGAGAGLARARRVALPAGRSRRPAGLLRSLRPAHLPQGARSRPTPRGGAPRLVRAGARSASRRTAPSHACQLRDGAHAGGAGRLDREDRRRRR